MCTLPSHTMDPYNIFEEKRWHNYSHPMPLSYGSIDQIVHCSQTPCLASPYTDFRSTSRQGFGKGTTKSNQNLKASYNNGAQSPSSQQPPMPTLASSPSIGSTYSQDVPYNEQETKKFLNEKHAKCSVKGNFLTLAAQPKNVDLGEWLAHQRRYIHPSHGP